MPIYVIFDVKIHDAEAYGVFTDRAAPAIEAAGGRYLVRGGAHRVHEGAWSPDRLVLLEFPSATAWEAFYRGETYLALREILDGAATARLVSVEGIASAASDAAVSQATSADAATTSATPDPEDTASTKKMAAPE